MACSPVMEKNAELEKATKELHERMANKHEHAGEKMARVVKESGRSCFSNDTLVADVAMPGGKDEEKIKQEERRIKNAERELEYIEDSEERLNKQEELEKTVKELDERIENKHEHSDERLAQAAKKGGRRYFPSFALGTFLAMAAGKGGRGCFPSDALVKLEDGKIIAMADLQVGHKVLSSVSNTKLEYSEVYFFAHFDHWKQSQYICICASKYKLKLTPDHHIFIVGNRNTRDTVPAEKINIGDRILIFDEVTASIQEETVTHLSRSTEVGIYAPITMSGSIIVDNVLVSC